MLLRRALWFEELVEHFQSGGMIDGSISDAFGQSQYIKQLWIHKLRKWWQLNGGVYFAKGFKF